MKKLFTILMMCFAALAVNAQTYLLQEGFEGGTLPTGWTVYDEDGDGFNWTLETGETTPHMTAYEGNGCMYSLSYDNDNSAALTPNNWMITPAITIPAGVAPRLKFWVVGQDASYAEEHYEIYVSTGNTVASFTGSPVFEATSTGTYTQQSIDLSAFAGQTIYIAFVHNEVTDMFCLNIDNVEIAYATEAYITANPSSLEFGNVMVGSNRTMEVEVEAGLLTSALTAAAVAPFEVSADGTTFGASASLGQDGGTLYVRFAPTAVGAATGNVTLTSGTVTETVAVSGSGFECGVISTFPYNCTFAAGSADLDCWETVDANGDDVGDHHGTCFFNGEFSTTNDGVAMYFYNGDNNADDWIISPAFALTDNMSASFEYFVASESYPETFGVYVIPEGQTYATATQVVAPMTVENTDAEQQVIDLSAYANQTVKIGIHVTSEADMWYIVFDNFTVEATGTGIAENNSSAVRVYPNPATNMINVDAQGYAQYELVNMVGQTISSNSLNNGNAQINVSNLSNGVYFVRLINGNNVETIKVIKK